MNLRPTIAPSIAPSLRRGLNREEAADYIGIGVTKFTEMVEARTMPKPVKIGSRSVWDVRQLDRAFDRLLGDTAAEEAWKDWK